MVRCSPTLFGVDTYVTDAAVQASLSAVYMAMAGEALNKGAEYYAKAVAAAKNVLDHKAQDGFVIDPDWKQVYIDDINLGGTCNPP